VNPSRSLSSVSRSVLALSIACFALNGCVVAAIGGAAGGGYVMAQSSRSEQSWRDGDIKASLDDRWEEHEPELHQGVSVDVMDGRVMLTGEVPAPSLRDHATADAWKIGGVEDVINEIQIGPGTSFGQDATDTWILTRLRSELTFDTSVSASNYLLESVHGTVYVLGTASDPGERDRVLNRARNLPNVRRVVSHIRLAAEAPAAGNPPPSPPPGAQPYGAPPPYAPPPPSYAPPPDDAPPTGAPDDMAPPPPYTPPPPSGSHPITIQPLPQ
jgi:osmotically-inducible protein OsmY